MTALFPPRDRRVRLAKPGSGSQTTHARDAWRGSVAALLFCAIVTTAWSEAAWTPVPAGPNTVGTFRWRKLTDQPPDGREAIEAEWQPPAGGAPCQTTAVVQTYREWFEHADGSIENVGKPSDELAGMDWTQFGPAGRADVEDKKKKKEQAGDPNATAAGHIVDGGWCDQDPYYNGDDARDNPGKGVNGRPTKHYDGPSLDDIFFTGTRVKVVQEFEVCVYCFNADGTVGQPLACMKWRWERRKGGGMGTVSVPPGPSGLPSPEHRDAVALYVRRHTRVVGGQQEKFCPEGVDQQARDLIKEAEELNRQLAALGAASAEAEALRARIAALMARVRRLRGR